MVRLNKIQDTKRQRERRPENYSMFVAVCSVVGGTKFTGSRSVNKGALSDSISRRCCCRMIRRFIPRHFFGVGGGAETDFFSASRWNQPSTSQVMQHFHAGCQTRRPRLFTRRLIRGE